MAQFEDFRTECRLSHPGVPLLVEKFDGLTGTDRLRFDSSARGFIVGLVSTILLIGLEIRLHLQPFCRWLVWNTLQCRDSHFLCVLVSLFVDLFVSAGPDFKSSQWHWITPGTRGFVGAFPLAWVTDSWRFR